MKFIVNLITCGLFVLILTSCGLKSDLYMPEDSGEAAQSSSIQ